MPQGSSPTWMRLDHLLRGDIDHRNIVRYAVGHQQIFFVRRKCHVPDPLSDQKIFDDRVAGGVDDGDAVGGAERDKRGLAVLGHADADRLDRFAPQAGNARKLILPVTTCLAGSMIDTVPPISDDTQVRSRRA